MAWTWRTASTIAAAAALITIAVPAAATAAAYEWNLDANGNWNVPANWTPVGPAGPLNYPNGVGDVAIIPNNLSANRTITIPTGLTVTLGRIHLSEGNNVTIAAAGTGRILLQASSGNAELFGGAGGSHTISAPVQLASHLDIDILGTATGITFAGGLSQLGVTSRNVRINADGFVRYNSAVPNTYNGFTTVANGELRLHNTGGIAIQGLLSIGDDVGAAGSARVREFNDSNILDSVDVNIFDDGLLDLNGFFNRISDLTVLNGRVELGTNGGLFMDLVNMVGGTLMTGPSSRYEFFAGTSFVTSSALGPATIAGAGVVALGTAQGFQVGDGPQPIDFRVDVAMIGAPGEGVTKTGPGVALFAGANTYSGATTVEAGTLLVTGSLSLSAPVNVTAASAILGGTGTIGPVTVTAGRLSPGVSPGTLHTQNFNIGAGHVLDIELGTTAGGAYDQLDVTGTVNVSNAILQLSIAYTPAPGTPFTIVRNDGTDTVSGTFGGFPEGFEFTFGGALFAITYVGGDGNDVVLQTLTAPISYFLAEGATGAFFDEDVLIANANTADAPVTLTFLLEGGATVVRNRIVPAQSRLTVPVETIPGLEATAASVQVTSDDGVPLIVERSMFWDASRYGGHTANAVSQAQASWVFAEGSQGFFDTYVLVANANASPTTVTMTFLREADTPVVRTFPMAAFSRLTVYAGDVPEVVARSFGVVVEATLPVTAERSMYFASVPGKFWAGGHNNMGIAAPSTQWFHAEGATGGFFNTFILLSNPQTTAANVELRFLLDTGEVITKNKVVGSKERLTINPAAEGDVRLENAALSTVVVSDVPIVSERSMYWPGDASPFGEGHNSAGVVTTATKWGLAEGRVGGPQEFLTYILLANPGTTAADVTITYLRESGAPVVKTYTVPPTSRFNVDVRSVVPEIGDNESFGAKIEVTNGVPIAVERSLYWNANGVFWAGGTNALATVIP